MLHFPVSTPTLNTIEEEPGTPVPKVILDVPGPSRTNEIKGNIQDIGEAGSLHKYLISLHRQYGPIASFWYGDTQVVSVADPDIFQQQMHMFDKPIEFNSAYMPLLGDESIVYAKNARDRRQAYDRCFTTDRIDIYCPIFQEAAGELVRKWREKTEGEQIHLNTDMATFSLKVILDTFFGDHFEQEEVVAAFERAYNVCWCEMESRIVEDAPPRGSDRHTKFEEAITTMKNIIKSAAMTRELTLMEGSEELLIDVMIEQSPNEEHLFADSLTYAVGGYHTIANLLTWCFYYLAAHPEVQERVVREMMTVLGEAGSVSSQNVKKLEYLMQVIQETMRCAVISPWASRYDRQDGKLGVYYIPKHTPIIQALGVVLQDENYWPDPQRFDPDRFNTATAATRPAFAFQPFGFAGDRKCPFDLFTYVETTECLLSVLRQFELQLVPGQDVHRVYGLVTHPSQNIKITLKQR
ncbi:hypothetical protein ScPMuIL_015326 [Solemya velum]